MNTFNPLLLAGQEVYVVDGLRTPFFKARGKWGTYSAADLAVAVGRALLLRLSIAPEELNEVILGSVIEAADEANLARIVALRLGCPPQTPAWGVRRNCGSGMQAIDVAVHTIARGDAQLILTGGVEVMSRSPLLLDRPMVEWLSQWLRLRSLKERLHHLLALRSSMFKPVIGLLKGLTDPITGLTMGQTAEIVAHRFHIDREEMDAYALNSHERALHAQNSGRLQNEILPLFDENGALLSQDDGVIANSNMAKLAGLPPYFDRPFGKVTAGNSAQISDGATLLLLASSAAVKQYNLPVLGKIYPAKWAALSPSEMGLGPVHAIAKTLHHHGLTLPQIDYWEINEAFAGQVLACHRALADANYCQEHFATPALGRLAMDRLNRDGGAIAVGHPVGASGARIVLHLLHVLKQEGAMRGMASVCIGGGQGGAMLVEAK